MLLCTRFLLQSSVTISFLCFNWGSHLVKKIDKEKSIWKMIWLGGEDGYIDRHMEVSRILQVGLVRRMLILQEFWHA